MNGISVRKVKRQMTIWGSICNSYCVKNPPFWVNSLVYQHPSHRPLVNAHTKTTETSWKATQPGLFFFFPTGTLNFPLLPPLPCLPAAPSSSFLPLFLHLGLLSLDPNQDPSEGYSAKALALTAPHLFNWTPCPLCFCVALRLPVVTPLWDLRV